ncbi:MAG TPA: toprim domain-containing protein [Stellaceae bacterium]|nr:toprim domain-containing protein [Stellaceae bacterium]
MTPGEALTARLGGRWHGTYGEARCPAHDDRSPSLSIRDGDQAPLLKCHAGCDQRAVLAAIRSAGGAVEKCEPRNNHTATERHRREAETRELVSKIWREARPIAGTLGESYLRERGITGPLPPTLRFSTLRHSDTGLFLPAIVAAVQGPDRSLTGLQRTYLRGDGLTKAPVNSPRKMLGSVRCAAVRLAAAESEMAIGEGIETGMSYQRATGIPTWAALSASGITNIVLPALPLAATVHLLVDLDPAGEGACAAAAERLSREGRRVRLCRPVAGNDFNDALRGAAYA